MPSALRLWWGGFMRITPRLLTDEDYKDALACESFAIRGLVPEDLVMWELFNHDGAEVWAHRRCVGDFAPCLASCHGP